MVPGAQRLLTTSTASPALLLRVLQRKPLWFLVTKAGLVINPARFLDSALLQRVVKLHIILRPINPGC